MPPHRFSAPCSLATRDGCTGRICRSMEIGTRRSWAYTAWAFMPVRGMPHHPRTPPSPADGGRAQTTVPPPRTALSLRHQAVVLPRRCPSKERKSAYGEADAPGPAISVLQQPGERTQDGPLEHHVVRPDHTAV